MKLPPLWRNSALVLGGATAIGVLASRLAFAPVPWPDGSAFYLPALELVNWPPQWRMHSQAAFVPTYDEVNFNLMPALPLLLGMVGRSGLPNWIEPALLLKIVSYAALLAWAGLLWKWLVDSFVTLMPNRKALLSATAIGCAALWDPIVRWGTLVVRTETWIGVCWIWILREISKLDDTRENTGRLFWRIAFGLALAAYFHFEAIYLVPGVVVGLMWGLSWQVGLRRLWDVGWRTATLLTPWLLYVLLHFRLFVAQMEVQFHRLAEANSWMASPYLIFHSLFLDSGSPTGLPKFFNLAKGVFWVLLLICTMVSLRAAIQRLRHLHSGTTRMLLATGTGFVATFYLWSTKGEWWFITLCHLTFWPWVGATFASLNASEKHTQVSKRLVQGGAWSYALLALIAAFAQARAISPLYRWDTYDAWVKCIERQARPEHFGKTLRFWQPHVPDVLVTLAHRQPTWNLTRTLDFQARRDLALRAADTMDVVLLSRYFNVSETPSSPYYEGPLRPQDLELLSNESELPFSSWALEHLRAPTPQWQAQVCERGPFWAVVLSKR